MQEKLIGVMQTRKLPTHPVDTVINPKEAIRLRNCGLSWREVGIELARQANRETPFHANSVFKAVTRYCNKRFDNAG